MLCADEAKRHGIYPSDLSLNPCFNGCYALINDELYSTRNKGLVLILVLMDVMR